MSSLLAWFRGLVGKYPVISVALSALAGWYAGPWAKSELGAGLTYLAGLFK